MEPLQKYMRLAIDEARKARKRGDYAIGATVVRGHEILAISGNRVRTKNDSTRHVELEAIQYAKGSIKDRYLTDCALYTTAEPCFMCLGACWWSGIRQVFYGIGQDDLAQFGFKFGTKDLRYRPAPFSSVDLIKKFKLPINLNQFMRRECLKMMYEHE
mgnify:CR=1 FL=1